MATLDLSKYGIKDVKEVLHNPSYDVLFAEETKPGLEGFEKGQVTELGAVNVMTGPLQQMTESTFLIQVRHLTRIHSSFLYLPAS